MKITAFSKIKKISQKSSIVSWFGKSHNAWINRRQLDSFPSTLTLTNHKSCLDNSCTDVREWEWQRTEILELLCKYFDLVNQVKSGQALHGFPDHTWELLPCVVGMLMDTTLEQFGRIPCNPVKWHICRTWQYIKKSLIVYAPTIQKQTLHLTIFKSIYNVVGKIKHKYQTPSYSSI
jgi:hypothetical protein